MPSKRRQLESEITRRKIRQLYETGLTASAIAKQLGVSYAHVRQIVLQEGSYANK